MIVTFHLAVYFVYYVWNTYISHHNTGNSESDPTSNDNDTPQSNNRITNKPAIIKDGKTSKGENTNRSDQDNSKSSPRNSVQSAQTQESTQVKGGAGDVHPCLPQVFSGDELNGSDLIYNVEPEYDCICTEKKIQFIPPVYIQRYMEIDRILKEQHWAETIKKVIDFGCAELNFVSKYLKKLYGIEEIVAVDIDSNLLERHCCKIISFPTDYLKKRPTPLLMRVFCGSVAHTHDSLVGADAVIAIELIEHLFPPELDCLPFTVFGFIKPKIAIFTTPNSDFNVLFTGMTGFRHPDHKFEWSQQQFQDWGNNLMQRYPDYRVVFKGIGPGPKGSEECGCCSQMATFIKINEPSATADDDIHVQDGPYILIRENDFPYFKDERTEEEKIKDAAECFITNCKMRCRICDEIKPEISIKSVMGRIQYSDKEKLIEILTANGWEIQMNSSGEEVVVFLDSEENSEPESNEYVTDNFENLHRGGAENSPPSEDNWDCVDSEMEKTLTGDQVCLPNETVVGNSCDSDDSVNAKAKFIDCTNIEKLVNSDKLNVSPIVKCSTPATTVPDIQCSDKLNSSQTECVLEKDSNLNFEKSIYETPYNNGFSKRLKSDCDLCDCSLPLSDEIIKGCKRSLAMESPSGFTQCEVDLQSEDPFCCLSNVSSSCDTSIYTTPCCSQRHKNNIPKCLSLQQISTHSSSPFTLSTELESTLTKGTLIRDQKDKVSKSMEGFKSLENDLTCSSTSRVIDSGYPDSYSEYNMDMDLTPEQFDDIETESEENDASSRSLSPPPPPPQIPWLIDDVQNGDVANNNRDGEGNNLVADMEEEPLEFEARIDEINNEVLNLAAANDAINFDRNMKLGEPFQENCGDCLPCIYGSSSVLDMPSDHPCVFEKSPNSDLMKLRSVFTEKNTEMLSGDSSDKQGLRNTKSDTSIATNYSWSLDPFESQTNRKSEGVNNLPKKQNQKLKTRNSLTTVLNGFSKFSNCSLVHPVEVYQVTGLENNDPKELSKSMPSGSKESVQQASTSDVLTVASLTSTGLQDDRHSLLSVYQSAESLNNTRVLQIDDNVEIPSFPDWLLNILVSDLSEDEVESADSMQSVWDADSLEERMEQINYDVQVDARGGGDPQRDPWQ